MNATKEGGLLFLLVKCPCLVFLYLDESIANIIGIVEQIELELFFFFFFFFFAISLSFFCLSFGLILCVWEFVSVSGCAISSLLGTQSPQEVLLCSP